MNQQDLSGVRYAALVSVIREDMEAHPDSDPWSFADRVTQQFTRRHPEHVPPDEDEVFSTALLLIQKEQAPN